MRVLRAISPGAFLAITMGAAAQLPVTPPASRSTGTQPASPDLCPLVIYIDAQGRLYDSRFGGRYRVTEQTLRNDVGGGCKERGATSSVRIEASPKAKFGRLNEVVELVQATRPDVPVTTITPRQQQ